MKKKLFAMLLTGALLVGVCVGCETHTHTFAEGWTNDETHHWHAATCDHAEETSERAEHVFQNGVCSVCGYKSIDENTDSNPPHTHTFAEGWTNDETHHWHAATCDHAEETSERAEHVFQNGVCSVCGYISIDENTDPNAIISDKVTEEEWRAALSDELIHNFKLTSTRTEDGVTMSLTLLFGENAFRYQITQDGTVILDLLTIWDSAAGQGDRYMFEPAFNETHSGGKDYTHSTFTFEPNGFPSDMPEYSCEDGMFFIGELPYLRENFSKVTYDEELGGYTFLDTENEWVGEGWNFLVKFKGGRMCALGAFTPENPADGTVGITYGYGTLTEADFAPPAEYTEK